MLDLRNLAGKTSKFAPAKPKRTISCSVKLNNYNNKKAIKALKHNLRLTKQQSVVEGLENQRHGLKVDPNGNWVPYDLGTLNKEERLAEFNDLLFGLEKHNKEILNDPNNMDNYDHKYKRRRLHSQFEHNLIGEGVIHMGKTGGGVMSKEVIDIVLKNCSEWLEKCGLRPNLFAPVMHNDEEGQPHLHFLYSTSNEKTGMIRRMKKADLQLLQTMVASNLEEHNFERGANWDTQPVKQKHHEDPYEYKTRINRENKMAKLIEKSESLTEEIKDLERNKAELISDIETISDDKEELVALISSETGDVFLKAMELYAANLRDSAYDQSDFSPEVGQSFVDKINKLQMGGLQKGYSKKGKNQNSAAAANAVLKIVATEKAMEKTKKKKRRTTWDQP